MVGLAVGALVWEKWCSDWYMGQVVAAAAEMGVDCVTGSVGNVEGGVGGAGAPSPSSSSSSRSSQCVKIHIHGEPETRDKWYDAASANVIELVHVDAVDAAVGAFPQEGDTVELLVIDASLAEAFKTGGVEPPVLLMGTVQRVYPARDACMVRVEYPSWYVGEASRRVCVSHGYIRVLRDVQAIVTKRGRMQRVVEQHSSTA